MNDRTARALVLTVIPGVLLGVALGGLPGCELLVNLDRSVVEAGPPDGCSICTEVPEGGGEGGEGGQVDGGRSDVAAPDSASTDATPDATGSDGGSEGAATDAGAGGE